LGPLFPLQAFTCGTY